MLENFYLVAVVIIILWLAFLAYYLYISRQHRQLESDIESLKALLGEEMEDES